MNHEDFDNLVNQRIDKMQYILCKKSKEYSQDGDKLYNFKEGAEIAGQDPKQYLWSLATKHLLCVRDMCDNKLGSEYTDEKIGDAINYLVLLEALLKENNSPNND